MRAVAAGLLRLVPQGRCGAALAGGILLLFPAADAAHSQTMPGQAYYDLVNAGHDRVARDLSRRLDLRSRPDRDDVEDLLERWEDDAGGPETGYDWLAVARLWVRADEPDRARSALRRAEGSVPEGLVLLERARIAFLREDIEGVRDYWAACEQRNEAAALEAWLDIEVLATPAELEEWDRRRTLPAGQRDDCASLRRFWNLRAFASGLEVDDRILQHYRRTRYALDHYRRRGRIPPRFSVRLGRPSNAVYDDRGLLYVRMGDPDEVAIHAGGECIEPNVSWAFNRPDGYRVYHLSPLGDADDWYLQENLAMLYRCGTWDRNPMVAVSPLLVDVPPRVLHDLYLSRMAFDPGYARIANQALNRIGDDFVNLRVAEQLAEERQWTWADGEYAVTTVPERPDLDLTVNFAVEWLGFRAPRPGLTRVWLNGLVEAGTLRPAESDGEEEFRVGAVWTVRDSSGDFLRRVPATFELPVPESPGHDAGLAIRFPMDLAPGQYVWMVALEDLVGRAEEDDPAPGGYATGTLTVRDMSTDLPLLSDVAVSPDSTGRWIPAAGIRLNPSPTHATNREGIAWIYFEAYNLTPRGRYETRVVLEPVDGGRTFDLSYPGDVPGGGTIVTNGYLRLDLSQTDPGRYRVAVTVRDFTSGVTTLPVRTEIVVVDRE